jgi:Leucine-rich repeat (LRR) protein
MSTTATDTMQVVIDKAYERTLGLKKKEVVGDAYEVIPIKDRKYARETVEIYLGRRGIEKLIRFEDFPNLEVLWLNDNKLVSIEGLDKNIRIKELYLHNNRLKTLEGSIKNLLHLRTVTLYNNELSDLDVTLGYFKNLKYLTHIELFDNPLSEEQQYRKRVIFNLKFLTLLDRHSRLE